MATATMTSKGQVTIPKEVRDELGLEAGTRLDFIRTGPKEFRLRAKNGSLMELAGILKSEGPPLSIEDMDQLIAEGIAEANR